MDRGLYGCHPALGWRSLFHHWLRVSVVAMLVRPGCEQKMEDLDDSRQRPSLSLFTFVGRLFK